MAGIRDEITRWTREGASLEVIEERISRLPASDEEKSALWLWAWSSRRPGSHTARAVEGCSPTNRRPSLGGSRAVLHARYCAGDVAGEVRKSRRCTGAKVNVFTR